MLTLTTTVYSYRRGFLHTQSCAHTQNCTQGTRNDAIGHCNDKQCQDTLRQNQPQRLPHHSEAHHLYQQYDNTARRPKPAAQAAWRQQPSELLLLHPSATGYGRRCAAVPECPPTCLIRSVWYYPTLYACVYIYARRHPGVQILKHLTQFNGGRLLAEDSPACWGTLALETFCGGGTGFRILTDPTWSGELYPACGALFSSHFFQSPFTLRCSMHVSSITSTIDRTPP